MAKKPQRGTKVASRGCKRTTQRRTVVASSKIHKSKTRMLFSSRTMAQKVIIVVVSLAIIAVIVAMVVAWFMAPERSVRQQISDLANNYYEEYFYPEIAKNAPDLQVTMKKYEETGFTDVSLLQLMVEKADGDFTRLQDYCDKNDTRVVFYPVAPYGRGDYRVEYKYSCRF